MAGPGGGLLSREEVNNDQIWMRSLHKNTLPETNMAPENNHLEKEIPIGNHHF